MCIASLDSVFSNTIIDAGMNGDNDYFIYQMNAMKIGNGKRCMLLSIPALEIVKIHDTTPYGSILTDYEKAIGSMMYTKQYGFGITRSMKSKSEIKKVSVGIYDCTYSLVDDLQEMLEGDEIEYTPELIDFYKKYYAGYFILIVSFSNAEEMKSQPLMVEYKRNAELVSSDCYFYPAIDNENERGIHSGIPRLGRFVSRDHLITFPASNGMLVDTSNAPDFLRNRKIGWKKIHSQTVNGDLLVLKEDLEIYIDKRI